MEYPGMSRRERSLLQKMDAVEKAVFTPKDVQHLLSEDISNVHRILNRLWEKKLLVRIERGKYVTTSLFNEIDLYELAAHVFEPSYISLWSALHYYKLTTQVPREIFLIVVKPRRNLLLNGTGFHYVSVKAPLFFGYEADGKVIVATREKLLLDCLLFPHYCGGWEEIFSCFENVDLAVSYTHLTLPTN